MPVSTSPRMPIREIAERADVLMERIDEIPEGLRSQVTALCKYILEEVTFATIIPAMPLRNALANFGITTLPELLSRDSQNLFAALKRRRVDYRRVLRALDNSNIYHNFEEKPWELGKNP